MKNCSVALSSPSSAWLLGFLKEISASKDLFAADIVCIFVKIRDFIVNRLSEMTRTSRSGPLKDEREYAINI